MNGQSGEDQTAAKLEKTVAAITPVSPEWGERAQKRLDQLAIPQGSLGELLVLARRLAAIGETLTPVIERKAIVTMAADHGVAAEGVSAFSQEVTAQMVQNFVRGGASINILADVAGADVIVVDMGVVTDLSDLVKQKKIRDFKIAYGTRNMVKEPAMTRAQALCAIEAGIAIASTLIEREQVQLLATGDMGIANTTASSAILAVLTGLPPDQAVGPGTGISNAAMQNKAKVIERAIALNAPDPNDPIDVLAKIGGFEIGGIAGVILGAAEHKIPVIVDGFISTAGALIARALAPDSVDYMIASHQSSEAGHKQMWQALGLRPLLDLGLRLGEGTGAAMAMNIVESAARVISDVLTFAQSGVTVGTEA